MFYDYCEMADGTQVGYSERFGDGSIEVNVQLISRFSDEVSKDYA